MSLDWREHEDRRAGQADDPPSVPAGTKINDGLGYAVDGGPKSRRIPEVKRPPSGRLSSLTMAGNVGESAFMLPS